MGVDLENPRFATSEATKDIVSRINRALDEFDRQDIAKLNKKVDELKAKHEAEIAARFARACVCDPSGDTRWVNSPPR